MGQKGSSLSSQTIGPNGPGVTFYQDTNYGGQSFKVGANYSANSVGSWNDQASSAKVDPGIVVEMYADSDYGGQKITIISDTPSFVALDFNDKLSSLKVYKNCGYDGYKWDADCDGECATNGQCIANRKAFCGQNRTDQRCMDWCAQVGNVCDALTMQYCAANPTNEDVCGCYNLTSVKPLLDTLAAKGTTLIPRCHIASCAANAKAWQDSTMRGIQCPDQQICIQSADMKVSASTLQNVNLNCANTSTTAAAPAPTPATTATPAPSAQSTSAPGTSNLVSSITSLPQQIQYTIAGIIVAVILILISIAVAASR